MIQERIKRGPPSSPPIGGRRLIIITAIQINASMQNIVTENASVPGNRIDEPIPRNTLTAFEPVTLPIDESAYSS
ncbi:Ribulose bisphosphate carboxylase small subunit [Dirofilaria immitis]